MVFSFLKMLACDVLSGDTRGTSQGLLCLFGSCAMYTRYRLLVLSTSRTEVNLFCSVGALSYNLFMSIFIFVGEGGHFTRVFQRFCPWAARGYPASPQKKRFPQGGASALGKFLVRMWRFGNLSCRSGINLVYRCFTRDVLGVSSALFWYLPLICSCPSFICVGEGDHMSFSCGAGPECSHPASPHV